MGGGGFDGGCGVGLGERGEDIALRRSSCCVIDSLGRCRVLVMSSMSCASADRLTGSRLLGHHAWLDA